MSERTLANKTLFISGASRGIGKAIALRAAHDAADLRLHLAQLERWCCDAPATAVAHDAMRAAWWSGQSQAETPARVGFAFPGNGVQRLDMGLGLIDFDRTARALAAHVDLVIEVGPGRALSGLIDGIDPGYLCLPIEPKPLRTRALHIVAAALFAHRAPVKWPVFFKSQRRAWASAQP